LINAGQELPDTLVVAPAGAAPGGLNISASYPFGRDRQMRLLGPEMLRDGPVEHREIVPRSAPPKGIVVVAPRSPAFSSK